MNDDSRPKHKLLTKLGMAGLVAGNLLSHAAASQPTVFGVPIAAQSVTPETNLSGTDRFQAMMKKGDLVIADPWHPSVGHIYAFLASQPMIDGMRATNADGPYLEFPRTLQGEADRLRSAPPELETIQRNRFIREVNKNFIPTFASDDGMDPTGNLATLVRKAPSAHFVDSFGEPDSLDTKMFLKTIGFKGSLAGKSVEEQMRIGDVLLQQHPERFVAAFQAAIEERVTPEFNQEIVDRTDKAGSHRHRVIVYGAEHAELIADDLRREGRKVAIVAIHASQKAYEETVAKYKTAGSRVDYDKMSNFLIAENRFTDDPTPAPQTAPAQPQQKIGRPAMGR